MNRLKTFFSFYKSLGYRELLWCFFAVSILISPKINVLATVLLSLDFLISLVRDKNTIKNIGKNRIVFSITLLFFVSLFGLLYTDNYNYAGEIIETRVTIFLLPLFLASYLPILNREFVNRVFVTFSLTSIVVMLFLLLRATVLYFGDRNINHFLYSDFTYTAHPSYLSMYVAFSISILMFARIPFLSFNLKMLFVLFLSVAILLLMSKMGIIVLVIVLFYSLVQKSSKKQLLTRVLILLLSFSIVFIAAYRYSTLFHGKIKMMVAELTHTSSNTYLYSTGIRLVLWDSAIGLIQENFLLGVGTGDVRDASMAYSQRMNYPAQLGDMNVHNQFLQSFVAGGILGFLILLFVIIYPLILAIRQKEHLFILFFIIIIFNFFVESMLQRQMGVVFYSIFSSLIYAYMISPFSNVEKVEVYSD